MHPYIHDTNVYNTDPDFSVSGSVVDTQPNGRMQPDLITGRSTHYHDVTIQIQRCPYRPTSTKTSHRAPQTAKTRPFDVSKCIPEYSATTDGGQSDSTGREINIGSIYTRIGEAN